MVTNVKKFLVGLGLAVPVSMAAAAGTGTTAPPTGTTTPTCSTCGTNPPPAPAPVTATANATGGAGGVGGAGGTGVGGSASVNVEPGAVSNGGANVNVEGTHIPRWTGHIGIGNAVATAPGMSSALHRCKDSVSNGWNLAGLFGTSSGETRTDADCLNRELNLEEKRVVCGAAVQSLHHPNPLVVQNAMNAMAEACDPRFATAMTTTRAYFKNCTDKGMETNVIGECVARPMAIVAAAPAPVAEKVCPTPEEPKGEVRNLCVKWKKIKNPEGTCPAERWDCVGGYKKYKVIPVVPK